jgi:hypothetical protein
MHFATKAAFLAAFSITNFSPLLSDTAMAGEVPELATPNLPQPGHFAPTSTSVSAPTVAAGFDQPSADAYILGARSFTIPFTVDTAGTQPTEVRLYVANGQDAGSAPEWKLSAHKSPSEAVKQFQYVAEQDGELWFATRTIDLAGNPHPAGLIQPQLKVFIDTTKPILQLQAEVDFSGRVDVVLKITDATPVKTSQLRYATDKIRQWQDLRIEDMQPDGKLTFTPEGEWSQLSLQFIAADTAGNQSVVTEMLRRPRLAASDNNRFAMQEEPAPSSSTGPEFRLSPSKSTPAQTVSSPVIQLDRNQAAPEPNVYRLAHGYVQPASPNGFGIYRGGGLPARTAASPAPLQPQTPPYQGLPTQRLAQQEVPAENTAPPLPDSSSTGLPQQVPSESIAPPAPDAAPFGPPSLYGDKASSPGSQELLPPPKTPPENGPSLNAPSLAPESIPLPTAPTRIGGEITPSTTPPPTESNQATKRPRTPAEAMRPLSESSAVPMRSEEAPASRADRYESQRAIEATAAARAPVRYSDSERFSLEYELQAIGSLGADAIELYGSVDGGKSWDLWGRDPDRVSPFDIETREEGVFAYRIVVVGRNGLASPRPLSGDTPDIVVVVDKSKPNVRITGAQYGDGDRLGALVILYECVDPNLMQRPIALSFSDSLEGPWTTIAGGLRNDGEYVWPADPQLPRQLYLRIDATDQAGNVGSYILDKPIDTQGLAPRARIRGFQSLSGTGVVPDNEQTANRPQAALK